MCLNVLCRVTAVFLVMGMSLASEIGGTCLRDDWLGETCSAAYNDTAAQLIQAIYSAVATADCLLANPCDYPSDYCPSDGEEYDFIIIGAGSAGSTVANRLTEESTWTVLVLEAGGKPTKTSEVPALVATLQKSALDWQYKTNGDENCCLGFENNQCNLPRGKTLGGSSTINYMLYVRGNERDYNRWANVVGDQDWLYDNVLPYFKKSEDMRAEEVLATEDFSKYHSTGGNLKVEHWNTDYIQPLVDTFADGMKELGYEYNQDCNGKNQSGFVRDQGTKIDETRCNTAKAFLAPIKERQNLKVSTYSVVIKILINETTNTAYGVQFINEDGNIVTVKARKEVIVSAGAIGSPQLLMVSGIGPKDHLEECGIDVVEDLHGVGENLEDHMLMLNMFISLNYSEDLPLPAEAMLEYLLERSGLFTGIKLVSHIIFINTKDNPHPDWPTMEIYLIDFAKNDSVFLPTFLNNFNVRDEFKQQVFEVNANSLVILFLPSLLRPKSKGFMRLNCTDSLGHPNIKSGYFTSEADVETFLETYDFAAKLVKTEALQKFGAELHEVKITDCTDKYEFKSNEYRRCAMRYLTSTTFHPCCTCKMGPTDSADSVVDSKLRVIGINNLRVCDASIMPHQVSGNLNAPTIMIGEKCSDYIKNTWLSDE